jgi:Icc-related predicted phosphoesterase
MRLLAFSDLHTDLDAAAEIVAASSAADVVIGAGVPVTPWDWSFDLTEEQAAEMLADCPEGAVLVIHSPPKGHCDVDSSGNHLGSEAELAAIEAKRPVLAVCGHIHDSWGTESDAGPTHIVNLGPKGTSLEV